MKKMMIALMAVLITVALAGIGTYAYFNDTATSSDNIFTAGTLNLKLADNDEGWADGVTATWASPANWAPGQEVDATIHLMNAGSIPAEAVYAYWNNLNDSAGLANVIEVTWLSDSTDIGTNNIDVFTTFYDAQGNNDGELSLAELVNGVGSASTPPPNQARFYGDLGESYTTPVIAAGGTFDIKMIYKFMESAGNEYQGKWATFDLTLTAVQKHYDSTDPLTLP